MIDYYHLADNQYKDQVFIGPIGNNTASSVFYWIKPRGITMIHITAIGAGGGGGSGNSSVSTAASGGSGGGSGAITRLTIPAIFLTDSLEIKEVATEEEVVEEAPEVEEEVEAQATPTAKKTIESVVKETFFAEIEKLTQENIELKAQLEKLSKVDEVTNEVTELADVKPIASTSESSCIFSLSRLFMSRANLTATINMMAS